jgi:hypothetical protein
MPRLERDVTAFCGAAVAKSINIRTFAWRGGTWCIPGPLLSPEFQKPQPIAAAATPRADNRIDRTIFYELGFP